MSENFLILINYLLSINILDIDKLSIEILDIDKFYIKTLRY